MEWKKIGYLKLVVAHSVEIDMTNYPTDELQAPMDSKQDHLIRVLCGWKDGSIKWIKLLCSKHIEVQHHWVREKIKGGLIELEYVPMVDQVADIFMKPLMAEKFRRFHGALGLVPVKSRWVGVLKLQHEHPILDNGLFSV